LEEDGSFGLKRVGLRESLEVRGEKGEMRLRMKDEG
jgi:hypothetical protein